MSLPNLRVSFLMDEELMIGLSRLGLRNLGNFILSLIYRILIGTLGGIMLCEATLDGLVRFFRQRRAVSYVLYACDMNRELLVCFSERETSWVLCLDLITHLVLTSEPFLEGVAQDTAQRHVRLTRKIGFFRIARNCLLLCRG
jgi:hypothetical protein